MNENPKIYRFNLRNWLMKIPLKNRGILLDKIQKQSGQSKATIKRIIYMPIEDRTYVRAETKEAICSIFGKSINEFEKPFEPNE